MSETTIDETSVKSLTDDELQSAMETWDGKNWCIVRESLVRVLNPDGTRLWSDDDLNNMPMRLIPVALELRQLFVLEKKGVIKGSDKIFSKAFKTILAKRMKGVKRSVKP